MAVVLFVLALASLASGAAAVFFGSDILLSDRGLPMIVAGATIAAAGLVLLGLAAVARGLKRVERRLAAIAPVPGSGLAVPVAPVVPAVTSDTPTVGKTPPAAPPAAAPLVMVEPDDDSPRLPLPDPPAPSPTIVGRYASGGNSYVMFSDGSIEAETPSGRHRFPTLDELRAFVAAGGEKGEPS